jgi:hypothetical protein
MFQRADQILVERNEDSYPLHALDFSWEGFEPSLSCYDSRDGEVSEFDLSDLDFSVSRKRVCIGYFDDGGRYVHCPKNAAVDKFSQCPECSKEVFLPVQECVFNPECEGERCGIEFCKREHVLYVAFYDTRMKIGMSSSRRVEKRLIEQGADAYALLGKAPNRKRARDLEKSISARLGIPQAVKLDIQLRNFVRKVDEQGIQGRYDGLKITMSEMFHLDPEPLRWIKGYPIELPLPSEPRLQDPCGRHKGRLVGIKGRWAIYESKGLNALNLSYLPSRFLSRE